ncbi:rhodanese-like domain-containing protein [Pengzhenrongella sicca]|uniref:Rhodanese-like domain-containing protein n=1 Tax=Pengzhenrongella sicca TaxID=2819238 RepID=A0A8A4ZJ59_9MICO|nr:rhodanese-like domain-containing protein [Pengzhenrongella sicca]QTE29638.1 rhodanese-like domain-containing protein [Pengzhenrongella sicca]
MSAAPDPATGQTTTTGAPAAGAPTTGYAGDLTPQQAWDLLADDERAVLVDVRTAAEWRFVGGPDLAAIGRSAALVEWTTYPGGEANRAFADQVAAAGLAPGDDRPVVFLCRSGVRSVAAARAATAAGLGPAYNILAGFEGDLDAAGHRGAAGWRAAGLPWRQS